MTRCVPKYWASGLLSGIGCRPKSLDKVTHRQFPVSHISLINFDQSNVIVTFVSDQWDFRRDRDRETNGD